MYYVVAVFSSTLFFMRGEQGGNGLMDGWV